MGEGAEQRQFGCMPNKVWGTWEVAYLSVGHTWGQVIDQNKCGHLKGWKPEYLNFGTKGVLSLGSWLNGLLFEPKTPIAGGAFSCIRPCGPWPCGLHTMEWWTLISLSAEMDPAATWNRSSGHWPSFGSAWPPPPPDIFQDWVKGPGTLQPEECNSSK